jgi:hypothetical protein
LVRIDQARIDQARSVPIESVVAWNNGLGLKWNSREYEGPDPDPSCGGTDRFSVNPRKRVFFCRVCRATGDVIAFVMHVYRCDFVTAVNKLTGDTIERRIIRPAVAVKPPPDPDDEAREKFKRAMRIWRETTALDGTLAQIYLNSRGIFDIAGLQHALRFHYDCEFGLDRHPCMIGLYRDIITNKPRAIHRTALTSSGEQIGKLTLAPTGGAAIKLDRNEDVHEGLHIAEGIETMLAGRQRYNFRPAWAVGNAGGIAKFPLLPGVTSLTVMVDNDVTDDGEPGAGPRAATECWKRWTDAGREFRGVTSSALGCDIADIIEFEAVGADNE